MPGRNGWKSLERTGWEATKIRKTSAPKRVKRFDFFVYVRQFWFAKQNVFNVVNLFQPEHFCEFYEFVTCVFFLKLSAPKNKQVDGFNRLKDQLITSYNLTWNLDKFSLFWKRERERERREGDQPVGGKTRGMDSAYKRLWISGEAVLGLFGTGLVTPRSPQGPHHESHGEGIPRVVCTSAWTVATGW